MAEDYCRGSSTIKKLKVIWLNTLQIIQGMFSEAYINELCNAQNKHTIDAQEHENKRELRSISVFLEIKHELKGGHKQT